MDEHSERAKRLNEDRLEAERDLARLKLNAERARIVERIKQGYSPFGPPIVDAQAPGSDNDADADTEQGGDDDEAMEQGLEPGELSLEDAVAASLKDNSLVLFERLLKNTRFVSFDTLRQDVWNNSPIGDEGIRQALKHLSDHLTDAPFTVEMNRKRAKLVRVNPDNRMDK